MMKAEFDKENFDMNKLVKAKIYLKNGIIIDEEIEIAESETVERIAKYFDSMRNDIKTVFRNNEDGSMTFGFTIVRFSDVSAVQIKE